VTSPLVRVNHKKTILIWGRKKYRQKQNENENRKCNQKRKGPNGYIAHYAVKTVAIKVSATHLCEERIRAGKRHSVSTLKLDYRLYKTQPLGYITLTWVIRFRSLTVRSCLRYNADLHAKEWFPRLLGLCPRR